MGRAEGKTNRHSLGTRPILRYNRARQSSGRGAMEEIGDFWRRLQSGDVGVGWGRVLRRLGRLVVACERFGFGVGWRVGLSCLQRDRLSHT